MRNYFKRFTNKAERGDTIVEVMISLIVLSLVVTSAYSIVSASLRSGTQANKRTEALALAQSQVDLLSNARTNDANFAADYQVPTNYCISASGSKDGSAQNSSDKLCDSYGGSGYNIGISYSGNIFTITAQWPSATATGGVANLNLYYKLPGVYKEAYVSAGDSSINGTTVTVNGTVTPNGNPVTNCQFVYDTSTNYTTNSPTAPCSVAGSGNSPVPTSASFSSTGLSPNTQYWFELCATNLVGTRCSDNSGTFTTPGPPVVNATSATNVGTTTATLNGNVDPGNNALTGCYFEYGPGASGAYTSGPHNCPTPWPGAGAGVTNESVNISGLSANSVYHFRLVAANAVGPATSYPVNFSTVPPPTVVTGSASNISYSSAKLNGTINPNGNTINSCSFYYGTSPSFGSSVGPPPTQCNGSVSAQATFGYSPSTTYYFQLCVVTSAFGQTCDGTNSFVTPTPPPPPPPSGLTGKYYQGANFNNGPITTVIDPYINWCSDTNGCENGWLNTLRSRTGLSEASCVSVSWTGKILADNTGNYSFRTYSDDGIRVVIDGNYIINNWTQHAYTQNDGSIYLNSGLHTIQVDYQNNNGDGCNSGNDYSADAILEWAPPGSGYSVVPQDHLQAN